MVLVPWCLPGGSQNSFIVQSQPGNLVRTGWMVCSNVGTTGVSRKLGMVLPTEVFVVYDMRDSRSPCRIMYVVYVCCTYSLKKGSEDT